MLPGVATAFPATASARRPFSSPNRDRDQPQKAAELSGAAPLLFRAERRSTKAVQHPLNGRKHPGGRLAAACRIAQRSKGRLGLLKSLLPSLLPIRRGEDPEIAFRQAGVLGPPGGEALRFSVLQVLQGEAQSLLIGVQQVDVQAEKGTFCVQCAGAELLYG